jgi:phosphatidylglycerophosphate synthase
MAILVWFRPFDPSFVLGLMALAGITDVLDGWLERRRRKKRGELSDPGTTMGAWLDPLCDKIFMLSLLAAITSARSLPLWLVPLIALREILQTLVAVGAKAVSALRERLHFKFGANVLGKATTVTQFLSIAAILLHWPGQIPLALAAASLGLVTVVVYVRRALP